MKIFNEAYTIYIPSGCGYSDDDGIPYEQEEGFVYVYTPPIKHHNEPGNKYFISYWPLLIEDLVSFLQELQEEFNEELEIVYFPQIDRKDEDIKIREKREGPPYRESDFYGTITKVKKLHIEKI